jgi:L-asparaginase
MILAGLPVVSVLAIGGTIASTSSDGVAPTLTAEQLIGGVPELAAVATVDAETFQQTASSELRLVELVALARGIDRRLARGDVGVVVTHCTDTVEGSSCALNLLVAAAPVVVTGAMRSPSLPRSEGVPNLLAAMWTAAGPRARGLGALLVFDHEIHPARFVRRARVQSIIRFRSSPAGPIGRLAKGAVCIGSRPVGRWRVACDEVTESPPVALLVFGQGDEGLLLSTVQTAGCRGLVSEGTSRTAAGPALRRTYLFPRYSFPRSEINLLGNGRIPAGALTGVLARMLVRLLMATGTSLERVRQSFEALAAPGVRASLLGGRFTISA